VSFKADRRALNPAQALVHGVDVHLVRRRLEPTTPHRVDGQYWTRPRGGITLSNGRVQRERAWNRLYGRVLGTDPWTLTTAHNWMIRRKRLDRHRKPRYTACYRDGRGPCARLGRSPIRTQTRHGNRPSCGKLSRTIAFMG
jgi:hypothetical protein